MTAERYVEQARVVAKGLFAMLDTGGWHVADIDNHIATALERAADEARAEEREACAFIAEDHGECKNCAGIGYYDQGGNARMAGLDIAAAIRARAKEQEPTK